MGWVSDLLKIVAAAMGTTKEWGQNKAEVPWSEIYAGRRERDKALAEKHRKADGDK